MGNSSSGPRRRWTLAAFTLAVAVAGCSSAAQGPAPAPTADNSGKSVHLAAVVSLSGAGESLGASQKRGIDLAVETVNKAGGVSGAKIDVDLQDDASTPQQGAALFEKAIKEKGALGVIGPTLAITAAAAHPVASGLKTPVIATSLTGAGVVGQCAYPCTHVFRDSLGEATAIPDNVKSLTRRSHPRSALIVYANDDSAATAGAAVFQHALSDNGVGVAKGAVLQVAKGATTVTDVVTAAVAQKADAWMISTPGPVGVLLMAEARKQGYKGAILGGNSFATADVSRLGGDAGSGAQSGAAYYPALATDANHAFVAAFGQKYKDADGKARTPDTAAAQAYSAVLLFAVAARRANLGFANVAADRTKLERALALVRTDSPMGTLSFNVQNDVIQPVYILAADGKGGFNLLDTYPPR